MQLDPERCLRALRSRDARFDGRFFVGVSSTGIYCRPVCPARAARVENLNWFACAAAAEEAGFRPCKRCRPETAPGSPAWAGTSATVARALRLIAEGALDETGVDTLAARLGVGDRHLRRLFMRHLGASPVSVAQTRRVHFARRLIDETHLPMSDVAWAAGFQSLRQFNDALRTTFGAAPSVLRRGTKTPARRSVTGAAGSITLRLPFRPPFDFALLLDYLAPRSIPGVEHIDGISYRRTVRLGATSAVLTVTPDKDGRRYLRLELSAASDTGLIQVVERVRRMFDLDADGESIARHLRRDARLQPFVPRGGVLRVPGCWDPFELAVRAVLGQQVSVAAATTLSGRLVERFGERLATPTNGLTHLFPLPKRLAQAEIETIGLPRARAASLRGLASAVANGTLRLDGSIAVEEAVVRLQSLPGIGAWTAQYVALRALGDPDALPASDLGLRRALARDGRPIGERELEQAAETWRPWRGYGAMALWTSGGHKRIERKSA
jgi:AraC family transcriptional regulator, regulatory protein of adaptative response / DNA-3-methyladenine glycosylase II